MSRWPSKLAPFLSDDGASIGIHLTKGRIAWIDTVDLHLVADHVWCAAKPRADHLAWYASRGRRSGEAGPRTIKMHTQLTGWVLVDHVDGNGLNNRRSNLRQATSGQNSANAQPYARRTSRFKGLKLRPNGSWTARVQRRYVGTYKTEEEAARAYDAEARRAFGEFARLNFPEGS